MVRPEPGGRGDRVARRRRRRGRRRRGDELLPTALDGAETRLAIPVNVATDARYRGQGVFSTLEQENEEAAAASGSPLTVTFPNAKSYPIFVRRLGWIDLPRLRLWARPLAPPGSSATRSGAPGERGRHAAAGHRRARRRTGSRCGRSTLRAGAGRARRSRGRRLRQPLLARRRVLQLALSRLAARLPLLRRVRGGELAGVGVVGHTFKHGSRRASSPTSSRRRRTARLSARSSSRAVREVKGGADALVLLPPPSAQRRALAPGRLRADEQEAPLHRQAAPRRRPLDERAGAWHFTLGDFDFF